MMTSLQRLTDTAAGKPTDRIPVFCNLLDQGARELGMSLKEYYSKGEYVAEGQLRMRERYGYDNVWALFYVGREAELMGCRKIIFANDGAPNVGEMVIKSYDDIRKLQIPDSIEEHPAFEEPLKCLKILNSEVRGKYPICAYLTASMTLPAMLMGIEKWMELLFNGPKEVADELLTKCSEFFQKQIAAYRKAGVDLILYTNAFGSPDFVPMKFFHQRSMPWMKRDLAPGGVEDIAYMCASAGMNPVIDSVYNELNIKAFHLGPLDDVSEASRIIDGRALCIGVINDVKMIDWSKDQVKDEVKRIIEAGKPRGRFMLSTQVMPYAIPDENIKAMMDAAFEFGQFQQ